MPLFKREEFYSCISLAERAERFPPPGWEDFLKDHTVRDHLRNFDARVKEYFPLQEDVFRALELCPPLSVRVIILGMDPYYTSNKRGRPMAVGLAFGTDGQITDSLRNIFRELKRSTGAERADCDLTTWALQGVLLLNASLTSAPGASGKHRSYWRIFTIKLLKHVYKAGRRPVTVCWGRDAQKLARDAGIQDRLESSHPSPLSAHRGFHGCGHFSAINAELKERGEKEIDWAA